MSDKTFSVREGRQTGPPYFLSVEALKLRQDQLHFFKWNHVPTTQSNSSHAKYENNRKIVTNRNTYSQRIQ